MNNEAQFTWSSKPRVTEGFSPLAGQRLNLHQLSYFRTQIIYHVRCIKFLTWLRCFRTFRAKIANFSRLHCLAIPRRDMSHKNQTKSLGVMLEISNWGLLVQSRETRTWPPALQSRALLSTELWKKVGFVLFPLSIQWTVDNKRYFKHICW